MWDQIHLEIGAALFLKDALLMVLDVLQSMTHTTSTIGTLGGSQISIGGQTPIILRPMVHN